MMINNSSRQAPPVDTKKITLADTVDAAAISIKTNTSPKEAMVDSLMVWDITIILTSVVVMVLATWSIMACSKLEAPLPRTSRFRMTMTTTKAERRVEVEATARFSSNNSNSTAINLVGSSSNNNNHTSRLDCRETRTRTAMLVGRTKPVAGVDPVGKAAKELCY